MGPNALSPEQVGTMLGQLAELVFWMRVMTGVGGAILLAGTGWLVRGSQMARGVERLVDQHDKPDDHGLGTREITKQAEALDRKLDEVLRNQSELLRNQSEARKILDRNGAAARADSGGG